MSGGCAVRGRHDLHEGDRGPATRDTVDTILELAKEVLDEYGDDSSNTRIVRMATWIVENAR